MKDETNGKIQEQNNSYNQIAKATGIFGGVQLINVLISIIRSKFVAVLLGTNGVGIIGLFTAAVSMISNVTNLGISFSAVRTISAASASNDLNLLSRTVVTHNRWLSLTAFASALITLVLSPQLSKWSFGNETYTYAFMWLSISLFFQAFSNGQLSLLQGLRKIGYLAKANVLGSFVGLCLSVPLYYWLGLDGIVPSIVITALLSLILSWYFTRKLSLLDVRMTYRESFWQGIDMVKLGSVMMLTGFASTAVMYLIRLYISQYGGLEQVGLYTAAWAIFNGYVAMVFNAMGTDYFPRLTGVSEDNSKLKKLVNEQAEIAIIILGPLLILLVSTLPIVIRILFSEKFMPVIGLIQWALLGVFFKAASWSIAFILLAKGDKKIYFLSEVVGNLLMLVSNIIFYRYYHLKGIGMAYLISYILYFIFILMIVQMRYSFNFSKSFLRLFTIIFILYMANLILIWQLTFPYAYFSGALLLMISLLYTYFEVKERIDLSAAFQKVKLKWKI